MLLMVQTLVPGVAFATNNNNVEKTKQNLVKVGELDTKSYPKLDNKTILAIQKQAREKHKTQKRNRGAGLFSVDSPYLPGQSLTDEEKAVAYGKVNVNFKAVGLNDNGTTKEFQWKEIFGEDSNGNRTNAKIHFIQRDVKTRKELGRYTLYVNKAGEYKWTDTFGKEALLPLYSDKLEPYKYEAYLDYQMTDKVKLLTMELGTTNEKSTFKKDEQGRNVATIPLKLELAQVASTRFSSEWKTNLEDDKKPVVEGLYNTKNKDLEDHIIENLIAFPKNNTDFIQLRNNNYDPNNPPELPYDQDSASAFRNVPEVKVVEGLDYSEDEENGKPTYNIDEKNKIITSLEGSPNKYKFRYDLEYDVINGGKLTMTEVIPVTFDANGGKFAKFTAPDTEKQIVKEVDYDGTLTNKADTPTKPGKAFKGWATEVKGTTPAVDSDYKNLKAAKTFYAIWSDEDIQVEELKTTESLGRFPKKGDPKFTNDFVPTFDELKAKVKVKDANGNFGPLPDDVKFSIVDDNGTEYDKDSDDLKKFIYEKVKENNKGEVSRTETVKAKITYSDGTTRDVEISIKVLKNIYKGDDDGNKYPHIPDDYVKVTINPTDKAQNPDKTYYYVNPKAKVVVPKTNTPVGKDDNKFSKWTMKADSATGDGADYTFGTRQIYKEDSTITAQYGTGIVKIAYVDQDGNKIDDKYKIDGQDYPSEKSGGLGISANDNDFAQTGPEFKGYIFSSKDSFKGNYKDPKDPDVGTVTYKYNKKVTTTKPKYEDNYFKVIFNANGGKFGTDAQKTLWVYMYTGDNPVTFGEARAEIESEYGLPIKDKAEFKEWQDKKADGTKVADNYVINTPDWDWTTYPETGYTSEVFYAHYGKASANIAYLDLDGKPIADEFKISTEKYPTEKDGKAGDAIDKNVYAKDSAPKFTGYKFNRIELNPANAKYAMDNKATIKIYYEKLPHVIPKTKNDESEKPDGYVEVKFVPTDKAKDKTEKIFYVNPKKDVTIPVANPEAKATFTFKEWKMGANAEGATYTPSTAQKFTEKQTVITATYGETDNIIPYDPSATDPMARPDGYVRVTFAADPGLKLTEQKAYYVKASAGIKLENAELVKPGYKAETGYKFNKWDKEDSLVIEAADILVTAKATKLDKVIPEKDDKNNPNEKPEGYKEVTFVVKTGDEDKGSITGVAKFYVNPTEYVKINPPTTKANTGFEFGSWDKDATIPTVYDKDTTIEGSFNGLKDVIPKTKDDDSEKPKDYVTVTFELEKLDGKVAGKIVDGETITYFVKPNTDVTIPQPKTLANTGYEFKEWNPDTSKTAQYSKNTTVKGSFTKRDDIIPSTKDDGTPNAKPEGYVTVTFEKGEHGEITGQTVYYVNPEVNPAKTLGDKLIVKPTVKAETGYKFTGWNFADTKSILSDITVIAQYKEIDDVIPKTNPQGGENEKPANYITVTFVKGEHGKLEGNTTFYVNPNKAVVLEGKAPTIKPNTGYTSAGWDTQISKKIQYSDGDKITALYNEIDDVIPQEKQDGSDKPDGYFTVTFDKGEHGELSGKTVYYVKPNKELTVPAPTVKPSVGYEFKDWDKALTQTFTADTTIKAGYKELANIIPQGKTDGSDKPDGYVTVTFKSDANGTLSGTTVYYVKPNVDIDLTDTAKAITKNPNTGYTAEGGTWKPAIEKKQYTADAKYEFNFNPLSDVIEKIDENTKKPQGYVTVIFRADDNGKLEGNKTEKIYYVNPKADIKLVELADGKIAGEKQLAVPKTLPAKNYVFDKWYEEIDTVNSIASERIHVAKFIAGEVTLTYNAGEGKGTVPAEVKVSYGTSVRLARPEGLSKENATFAGWKLDGEEKIYQPGDEVKLEKARTATAQWTNDKNIIPYDPNEPITRPEGYVKVTFAADTGLKLTEQKAYYVKKNAGIKLGNAELVKPKYSEDIGYKFDKWDKEDSLVITTDITVTAKATKLDNVIPEKDDKGNSNEKPKGYKEVTFVIKTDDAAKGSIKGVAKFYVNPNEYVTINPPATKANTGFEFGAWDKDATIPTVYKEDATITGSFNDLEAVIPKTKDDDSEKPEGYVTVTFKIEGQGGSIVKDEVTVYYVNPDKEVTVSQPKTKADTGYVFDKWDIDTVTTAKKYTENTTVTGNFKKLADIIPSTDENGKPNAKPEGYVTVTFDKGANGSLTGQTSYYVNPKAGKLLGDKLIVKPTVKAEVGYKFTGWDKEDTKSITGDLTVTAKYQELDNVIPKTKNDDSEKPAGYIKVTFDTTEKGKIKGTTNTTKVVFVNPNKAVVLKGFDPEVVANKGHEFERWDTSIEKAIQYKDKDTIKAIYKDDNTPGGTTPGGTTPGDKPGDQPGDKPGDNPGGTTPGGTTPGGTTPDQPGGTTPGTNPETPGENPETPGTVPENPGAIPGTKPGKIEKHGNRYVERVAGKNRVHTAINTSKRFFKKSKYVIIADSGNYPDALTATVLAHVLDAPILLNNTRYLEDDVAREIVRLGASEVIIVGGHKSISENVKSQLAKYDANKVQRIWGRDRYVTSSELAYEIDRLTGKVNKAIIASGENFPDALATAPLGSKEIAPILLVTRNQMDKKVSKALKDLNINKVYVAGGQNSVSKKLEAQLPQVIRRFSGQDRYETAILVASYTYPESKEVFVASGETFPDALVIGPVCARRKAPILLSKSTPVKSTDDYIEKSKIEYLYIIGGVNTIHVDTAHKYAIED